MQSGSCNNLRGKCKGLENIISGFQVLLIFLNSVDCANDYYDVYNLLNRQQGRKIQENFDTR